MKKKFNICHISDLHLGLYENNSYKSIDDSFRVLDSFIEFLSTNFNETEKPHFLLISGDITSISKDSEYSGFLQFIEDFLSENCLSKCLFDKYSARDRIIITPGNHDTVRQLKDTGKFGSDKLESFKRNIADKNFNTPLGNNKEICYDINEREKKRLKKSSPIPCSLFYYPEYNILFSVLVSCYLSHKFNPEVIELYKKYKDEGFKKEIIKQFKKDIENIIYEDYGHFPQLYRRKARRTLIDFKTDKGISNEKYENILKLAISHHHVIPLESRHKPTEGAYEMRKCLGSNGVLSILHGHLHDTIEERYLPKEWCNISSFFPCGTISGYCQNAVNKFNMIEIVNYDNIKKLKIMIKCYDIDSFGNFSKDRYYVLYSDSINKLLKSMNNIDDDLINVS